MYANAQSQPVHSAIPAISLHCPDSNIPPELQATPGWAPSLGATYYFVESDGTVMAASWAGSRQDHGRQSHNNTFPSSEKALARADRQALNRIADFLVEECGAEMAQGQFVVRRNRKGTWTVVNTGFIAPAEARFDDAEAATLALHRLQALGMVSVS